ncbi:LIM domain only protein 7-like isoform X3 [Hypomesus transpacificus]|uniref:LIM domain only protein 7-like isoform X3 n=1 Tax=Hypomesus transpacificus TaxID=137520 RepID=UPI001F0882EF|nr:LIM domain only protein 7-like isoform X3 [Hypomesus transpacificus]
MEWREHTTVSCEDAYSEAQRWLEEVTHKSFRSSNFRCALEDGVLLCDLINQLKPGVIKRVNRLSTPIAGLDNVNVFLRACGKLGLNEAQLFHPGDLQDLSTRVNLRRDESNRRLKNVLITIYWLGRKAQVDPCYSGPQLNLRAFEGLLGIALSKALEESSGPRVGAGLRDSGYSEAWYPEKEQLPHPAYWREESLDGLDSLETCTTRASSQGCGSEAGAEQGFRMESIPRPTDPVAQRDRGYIPAPLRRKRLGQEEDRRAAGAAPPSPLIRPPQVNPGWIWSKSLSDIVVRQWTQQPVRQGSEGHVDMAADIRVKDSEAKWQDDLTKWKNRRRSTTSDLRRKVQEREVTGELANGSGPTDTRSLGGLQEKRDQQPSRRQASSSSPLDSPTGQEPSAVLRPQTQAVLSRGYATESPFPPLTLQAPGPSSPTMLPSEASPLDERSHAVSLAADRAGGAPVSAVDFQLSSLTVEQDRALVVDRSTSVPGWSGPALPEQTRTTTKLSNGTSSTPANHAVPQSSFSTMDPPADTQLLVSVDLTTRDYVPNLHLQNHPPQGGSRPWEEARLNGHHPMDKQPERGMAEPDAGLYRYSSRTGSWSRGSGAAKGNLGGARVSATLPRGFRRSEGSCRLSVVVTPRPFGTKSSLVSTLPRLFKVVNRKSVTFNAEKDQPPTPTSPSSLRQAQSQSWPADNQRSNSEEDGKYEEEERRTLASLQAKVSCTEAQSPVQAQAHPQTHFQTQTRGGHAALPCPDTPRPGHRPHIPQRRHSDMRVSLSLKPNSRPDFGFQTQWDSTGAHVQLVHPGSPAEQCQLQVGDEIVAVGGHKVAQMSYKQWKGTMSSAMQTGSLTMDVRRYGNNDWASGASQHQSCHKTVNLTSGAPTLIGRPNQCANEQSEDADVSKTAAMTKPIQVSGSPASGDEAASKVKNVHEDPVPISSREVNRITLRNRKRRAEFFKQKGGSESAISDLQVPSISPMPCSWSWDPEEERRRQERWQEEQERLLQEKYRRDQERMEAEWNQAQQEAGGEVYRKPEQTKGTTGSAPISQSYLSQPTPSTNGVTNHKNNTELDQVQKEHVWKEAKSEPEKQGEERDGLCEQHNWSGGSSYGFTKLSAADRTKSTPVLDDLHKQETKGAGQEERRKRCSQGGASHVDQDRQRILEEMRKRTQLLTDNSWIRQRSSNSIYKEPIYVGTPMRRYESLDDLDITTPISSTVNQNRPHSAAGYSTPSRISASRYSLGAGSSEHHPPWSRPPSTSPTPGEEPHSQSQPSIQPAARLVSGSLACCMCERSLGRGAAMVIEALALCFHLACFQCVDCRHPLGQSEDGAQVRIRDRKPYCDRCYLRLRVGPPAFL